MNMNMPTSVVQQQVVIPPSNRKSYFVKCLFDTGHEFGLYSV